VNIVTEIPTTIGYGIGEIVDNVVGLDGLGNNIKDTS
jgi:hypothetical protein